MSQFHILPDHEITNFNKPPSFDKKERMNIFSLDTRTKNILKGLKRSPENKVGFMLQLGYFKATCKFFAIDQFKNVDIYYVAELLEVKVTAKSLKEIYRDRTRINHSNKILDFLGYEPWTHYEDLISEHVVELVAKQSNPKQIMLSTVDLLHDKKISTPSYDYFCKVISNHYRNFEQELISKLRLVIKDKHTQALDDLLDEGDYDQRKLLTSLKTICQSTAKKKIKESLHRPPAGILVKKGHVCFLL